MMTPPLQDDVRRDIDSLMPAATTDRRSFLAGLVATGFALAVQPVAAGTVIATDATGLVAGPVEVPAGDIALPAYRAMPQGAGPFPVVLVVQEVFGIHAWIQDVCRRLAKAGYFAVAPALYARQGDPTRETTIADIMSKIVSKVPDVQVLRDLDATAAWAGTQGGDTARLALTGYCWGGRITWLYAAHNPALKAAVAWYGRLVGAASELQPRHPLDVAAQLKAPVLGLYGGLDKGIPPDTVAQMQAALAAAQGRSRIEVFAEAGHGFLADYRPTYHKASAEAAWPMMLAWFRQHGV